MNRKSQVLLVALLGWVVGACSDDATEDGGSAGSGGSGGAAGVSGVGASGGSIMDGMNPSAGECLSAPNMIAWAYEPLISAQPLSCSYACERGFADCDAVLDNGCEVALDREEACHACGAAACLTPALCGLTEPVCGTSDGWQFSNATAYITDIAIGEGASEIYVAGEWHDDTAARRIELPMTARSFAFGTEDGAVSWATQTGDLPPGEVVRAGERLYFTGLYDDAEDNAGVQLVVTDLSGALHWTAEIAAAGARFATRAVAIDGAGNAFWLIALSSGELELDGVLHDAAPLGPIAFLVAYDATGEELWRRKIAQDGQRCDDDYVGSVKGLKMAGERLIGVSDACLLELSTDDGAITELAPLYGGAALRQDYDRSVLAADAEGNLYVAGVSSDHTFFPPPDAAMQGDQEPDAVRTLFVSKYAPGFERIWTRILATGRHHDDGEATPDLTAIDVTSDGTSYVLGKHDGRVTLIEVSTDSEVRHVYHSLSEELGAWDVVVGDDDVPLMLGSFISLDPSDGNAEGEGDYVWQMIPVR